MELTGDPLVLGLQITVTGVSVVFIALTLVALALGALRGIDAPLARMRQGRAAAPPREGVRHAAEVPPDQLTPELVAVLVAAATEALDQPVRVTRVRYHGQPPASAWSRQGRIAVMASRQRRG